MERRIIGLDLGVATDHTAVVLDEAGTQLARRRAQPTRASLEGLRKEDPQLARIYWTQMVERGANHTKALAVVAAHLARRLWRTLERQSPYVVRDTDGNEVDRAAAKRIIAEHWTVDEETRRRR